MLTTLIIQTLAHSLDREIPYVISPHQLIALNILLSKFVSSREQRIGLVNELLGLRVTSTRCLTQGQASALLQCAYPLRDVLIQQQDVDADFVELLTDLNTEKTHE